MVISRIIGEKAVSKNEWPSIRLQIIRLVESSKPQSLLTIHRVDHDLKTLQLKTSDLDLIHLPAGTFLCFPRFWKEREYKLNLRATVSFGSRSLIFNMLSANGQVSLEEVIDEYASREIDVVMAHLRPTRLTI